VTRYISLAEYFWLAEQVTGLEAAVLIKAARVDLADSALHAPQAGFGEEEFYADGYERACDSTERPSISRQSSSSSSSTPSFQQPHEMSCRPQRGQRSRSHPRWWKPPASAPQSPQRPRVQRSRAYGAPSIVTSESVQPRAVVISRLQSMHVAMRTMMHAGCDTHALGSARVTECAGQRCFLRQL